MWIAWTTRATDSWRITRALLSSLLSLVSADLHNGYEFIVLALPVWLLAVLLAAMANAYLDKPSPPQGIGSLCTESLTILDMD